MANTINDAVKPHIVISAILDAYVAMLTPLRAFSLDFSPSGGQVGETIGGSFISKAAADAKDWAVADGYVAEDVTDAGLKVTLNKRKYKSWVWHDIDNMNTMDRLEHFGYQTGAVVAKGVFQDILSIVTNANYGTAAHVGTAATFDVADMEGLKNAADAADWPPMGRSMVLDSAYYNALVADTRLNANTYGSAEVIRRGIIPELFGFTVYSSTIVPANSENLKGFICTGDALAVGMRYLMPDDRGTVLIEPRAVSDPTGGGLTFGYKSWYDPQFSRRQAVAEALYGFIKANVAALKRITSS